MDGAPLGRCASVILLALLAAPASAAVRADAASTALPDFLWSEIQAEVKRVAPAPPANDGARDATLERRDAVRDPTLQRREVREPISLPRPLDLTKAPDDLWERIRRGFAMPNLDSPLVRNRQVYYVGQKAYFERMVARSRLYMYHIVEEIEKRGMPTEIAAADGRERLQPDGVLARARVRPVAVHPLDGQELQAQAELVVRRAARHHGVDHRRARLPPIPLRDARRLAPGARLVQLG